VSVRVRSADPQTRGSATGTSKLQLTAFFSWLPAENFGTVAAAM
jgi:hypothetical protein